MHNRLVPILIPLSIVLAAGMNLTSCGPKAVVVDTAQLKMFKALPDAVESQKNPITEAKVNLGRMLYYEPRLSKNHDVSCNTCHDLAKYGVDGQPVSDREGKAERLLWLHRCLAGKRGGPKSDSED
jgi:cytochrome c peroxidase